jgi:hypothetical protein
MINNKSDITQKHLEFQLYNDLDQDCDQDQDSDFHKLRNSLQELKISRKITDKTTFILRTKSSYFFSQD